MKHIPNIISITRIFFSLLLLYLINNTIIFSTIYILCGLSDILDGFIARKTNTQSVLGAKLDSIADCFLFIIIVVILLNLQGNKMSRFIPLVIITFLIRSINLIFTKYKFKSFIMIHTFGNKITGIFLFITPLVCITIHSTIFIVSVCILSILSALEESIILVTSKKPDINRKSIFKL